MRTFSVGLILCCFIAPAVFAQSEDANTPATREDIQRYLSVMHAHEMMKQMTESMSKPMHQMVHQQYLRDKDKLPADFEDRMNRMMDSMFKEMPWDEMLDAEVPVYQRHFTKGDVDSLIAFYSSPTGQKLLRELPTIMSESMESMMPLIQKQVEGIRERVQQEFAQALDNTGTKSR